MQTAEQQQTPVKCGLYKKWQLTRLQKLYNKLGIEFNGEELAKLSRTELKKLLEKANEKVRLQQVRF